MSPAADSARRSMIRSPRATPPRAPLPSSNTPNGRFWIGKSVSGALALASQLRRAGSCVALSSVRMPALLLRVVLLAVVVHLGEQRERGGGGHLGRPLAVQRVDVGHHALGIGPVGVIPDWNV